MYLEHVRVRIDNLQESCKAYQSSRYGFGSVDTTIAYDSAFELYVWYATLCINRTHKHFNMPSFVR